MSSTGTTAGQEELLAAARTAATAQLEAVAALGRAIRAARDGGMSLRAIAAATGLSHETVRRIIAA